MVKKWEIWFVRLDPVQGSEQKGLRPVLVISNNAVNDNLPIFTCIPFSSIKPGAKIYPTEVKLLQEESGLPKDSVLMLQQISTVSVNRLSGSKVSAIDNDSVQQRINKSLAQYFELF